jgi:hypothetical protein
MFISQKHYGVLIEHAPILRAREIYLVICKKIPCVRSKYETKWLPSTPVYLSIYLSIYGSTALCWASSIFQFLNRIHSRKDSLDEGSDRRKASTYT